MTSAPTIYRRPTLVLPTKEPTAQDKRVWEKHRNKKNKSIDVPSSKTR
jgi:hypothetical protein